MDARSLEYPAEHFRCVIDKGTMDAMLSSGANRGEEGANAALKSAGDMMSEVFRVLKNGGAYLLISSMPPNVYIPTLKDLTRGNTFDLVHTTMATTWSDKLSLQVYVLTKSAMTPSALSGGVGGSGLPFSEEQMSVMMQYARAAQAEKALEAEKAAAQDGSTADFSMKKSKEEEEEEEKKKGKKNIVAKPMTIKIIKRDEQNIWIRWRIDMSRKTRRKGNNQTAAQSEMTPIKGQGGDDGDDDEEEKEKEEEEEEEEEEDSAGWGLTPMRGGGRSSSTTSEGKKVTSSDDSGDDDNIILVGGSERDYIVLTHTDTPLDNVHVYESMEWLELPEGTQEEEEEEEESNGGGEFGFTPTKLTAVDDTSSQYVDGIVSFLAPKKHGTYQFRYVAETIAWGLKEDTIVFVSENVVVGPSEKKEEKKEEKKQKEEMEAPLPPVSTSPTPLMRPSPPTSSTLPQTMSSMGPILPPHMSSKWKGQTVRLSYLLEKRTNISCFQLFVHRPTDIVGDVKPGTPPPPVPSPPHVRLRLSERYQPLLSCDRDALTFYFYDVTLTTKYILNINFQHCNIDPRKSTFTAQSGHWSFRMPFYYVGSESDVDRESPEHRLPRKQEVTTDMISKVRCKFCEEEIFSTFGLKRVTRAPSQYWSELADYWFCLKEQAAPRLVELSAYGGEYPIAINDVVIDRCSLLSIYESDGLCLEKSVRFLPLKSMSDEEENGQSESESGSGSGSKSSTRVGPILATGCSGTTYEILQAGSRKWKYGDNRVIRKGHVVEVHARGEICGQKFWDTRDKKGIPFKYTAGVGSVIRGWDQGCLGMAVGEKRRLIIPSNEGYGKDGFPSWGIPPNSTLTFVLEVVSIQMDAGSTTSMLRNELTKALLCEEETKLGGGRGRGGGGEGGGGGVRSSSSKSTVPSCAPSSGLMAVLKGEKKGPISFCADPACLHETNGGVPGVVGKSSASSSSSSSSSSSTHPAVLLCKRCLSTLGTSQPRTNGT